MPLKPDVLVVVLAIASVVNHEVTPVGVVFAIIPIVVVTMVPVIDPNLHTGLWPRGSHCGDRGNKGSRKEDRTNIAFEMKHVKFLRIRDRQAPNPLTQSLCTSGLAMYVPCSTYLETMISMEHKLSALFARLRKGREPSRPYQA